MAFNFSRQFNSLIPLSLACVACRERVLACHPPSAFESRLPKAHGHSLARVFLARLKTVLMEILGLITPAGYTTTLRDNVHVLPVGLRPHSRPRPHQLM